ncbi:hypothetical protein EDC01DRAFT_637830 [Geopyxis carbonaria]|nr:hypothetical protein EDC01DRAFT_637830 [Geopyxis carbonaria]
MTSESSTPSTTPAAAAGNDSTTSTDNAPDLTAVVDDLLDSLSSKFASVSSEIFEKIEGMSRRLDAMEQTLQQSGPGKAAGP